MKRNKIFKIGLILLAAGIITAGGVIYYMFNMPHRNIQSSKTDYAVKAGQLVIEYLSDPVTADNKYLVQNGDSRILEVSGEVASISEDYNNQKVILLKSKNDKAGVSCTFTHETNPSVSGVREGQNIIVKGVIRAGATYDEDLQMYENVILEKCDIVSKI
ncbi:MAG: hypothetical protein KFF73_09250 [Cyclobacteriaceae bacterium]|nr:hypothetical protein [Cyclobacteriaceae bacterium]